MKKALLICVAVISFVSCFGQKIRFSDSTNVWHILNAYNFPIEYSSSEISYMGDTLMGGIITEDTLAAKVYIKLLPSSGVSDTDSTEKVLYDYNWAIGDTVYRSWYGADYIHYVSVIDSTQIDSVWYRVWHFSAAYTPYGTLDYDVIEGIGCTNGPLFPMNPANFETYSQLTCFNNRGTTLPVSPSVSGFFNNASSCTLATDKIVKERNSAIVMPNPANELSEIVLAQRISSGNLEILTNIGKQAWYSQFQNKDRLLIGDKIKVPGIYLYRVTDNESGAMFYGKFVKQ